MSVGSASRSDSDLTPDERRLLANAHTELRAAVKNYEQYLGRELKPGTPIPVVGASELREAQERIDQAEENLWKLRERLLGWSRPASTPRASLVTDWFSEEDADYDQVSE
jgi:hypothetical protein